MELLERDPASPSGTAVTGPAASPGRVSAADMRAARASLRAQIARMESELSALFADSFTRRGIDWTVGAGGGPRVLGLAELERLRDALAARLETARGGVAAQLEAEESNRALVERMIADPAGHRWVRVRSEDLGGRGCGHWHSRPRWGLLGMIAGWWRVKLSSGCPLSVCPPQPVSAPRGASGWALSVRGVLIAPPVTTEDGQLEGA